jgi:hypothetical protein
LWSTLLDGLRSPATSGNPGPHSGGREIHGKYGVVGTFVIEAERLAEKYFTFVGS